MGEARRFFVERVEDLTAISGAEFHHMTAVLRLKAGDEVILCAGDGLDCRAVIEAADKKTLTCRVTERRVSDREPRIDVTLYAALSKGEHMDFVLQKANELGVNRIVPFYSHFTTAKADGAKLARMRRIVTESAKQCGRARVPVVEAPRMFSAVTEEFGSFGTVLLAYEGGGGDIGGALGQAKRIALVVGSEGGFAADEVETAARCGAKIVTLGKRILRTETAAIALLSAVMYLGGEW